jgi:hypothetical protein
MPHCIIVMFADAEKEAYHTGWLVDQEDAFDQITIELSKGRVAWIGWAYFCRHFMDHKMIERRLKNLAMALISNYRNNIPQRSPLRTISNLRGLADRFKNPVQVLHQQETGNEGYGFAYAQCTHRTASLNSSSEQRGATPFDVAGV